LPSSAAIAKIRFIVKPGRGKLQETERAYIIKNQCLRSLSKRGACESPQSGRRSVRLHPERTFRLIGLPNFGTRQHEHVVCYSGYFSKSFAGR